MFSAIRRFLMRVLSRIEDDKDSRPAYPFRTKPVLMVIDYERRLKADEFASYEVKRYEWDSQYGWMWDKTIASGVSYPQAMQIAAEAKDFPKVYGP